MNKDNSPDSQELVIAGIVGAIAGAVGAVVTTAMLDKESRKKLGKNMVDLVDRVITRMQLEQNPKQLKEIDSPKSK